MNPISMAVLLWIVIWIVIVPNAESSFANFAYCGPPRPTVVPLDAPNYRYYPYYALLHRCGGTCTLHPLAQRCAPLSYEEVYVNVLDRTTGREVKHKLNNHTRCASRCISSPLDCNKRLQSWVQNLCRCECKYRHNPPAEFACKEGFRWNGNLCKCECDLPPQHCKQNKVWSQEACACTCSERVVKRCARKDKGLDFNTCKCVDVQAFRGFPYAHPQSRMFITLLAGLGFVLVVLVCVLVHFVRKSRRLSSHENGFIQKRNISRSDSGNISCSNNSACDVIEKQPRYSVDKQGTSNEECDSSNVICTTPSRESNI